VPIRHNMILMFLSVTYRSTIKPNETNKNYLEVVVFNELLMLFNTKLIRDKIKKIIPMGLSFTGKDDGLLSYPPGLHSHCDLPHLNDMLKRDEDWCKSQGNMAEYIPLRLGI